MIKKFKKILKNLYLILVKYRQLVYTLDMAEPQDIEKVLKKALINSKMTRYRISQISGLSEAQLSYFVNGQRSLTLPAAAKLAKVLGLELKPKRGKDGRKK